ncbi:Protein of unknown function DUF761, plant [Dillenia turbinata]|uniref:Avr9/Cf-9 rapidly elicited protein 146 n=1 Tax=Dillenia turbinata TaxID=194707 RepID=A0AAN8YWF6_9MAGN
MEQNLPIIAKKIWNLIRVAYYMVRKGISKRKILVDLNMMMKRGKIAGSKAIHNLMFQHHHNSSSSSSSSRDQHLPFSHSQEYEFSCSNSPALPFSLTKRSKNHSFLSRAAHLPSHDEDIAVNMVLEMLRDSDMAADVSSLYMPSPYLPGFGRSPMVRPLQITDSPFPVHSTDDDETRQINKAAEDFISRFYNDLKRQNRLNEVGSG